MSRRCVSRAASARTGCTALERQCPRRIPKRLRMVSMPGAPASCRLGQARAQVMSLPLTGTSHSLLRTSRKWPERFQRRSMARPYFSFLSSAPLNDVPTWGQEAIQVFHRHASLLVGCRGQVYANAQIACIHLGSRNVQAARRHARISWKANERSVMHLLLDTCHRQRIAAHGIFR